MVRRKTKMAIDSLQETQCQAVCLHTVRLSKTLWIVQLQTFLVKELLLLSLIKDMLTQ